MNGINTEGFHLPEELPFSTELIAETASRIFNEIPLNQGTEYTEAVNAAYPNEKNLSEFPADSYKEIYNTEK